MLKKEFTDEQVVSGFNDLDEAEAYSKELYGLTKAQQCGDAICTFYSFDAPRGFKWAHPSAAEILELVTRLPWRSVHIDILRDEGVEMQEIHQGIEYFRAMNEDASNWVQKILNANTSAYDPMEASTDSGDVLEWLDEVTWEMPELMRRGV